MVEFLVSVLANVFIVPLFLADIFTEYTVLDDGNFLSGQGLDVPCLKASFALGKNSRANLVFSFCVFAGPRCLEFKNYGMNPSTG